MEVEGHRPKAYTRNKKPWSNQDFPPHKTWSGTVRYKRKTHYFTRKDVERIIRYTLERWPEIEEGEDQKPWLIGLIDKISTFLMEKIVGTAGLNEDFAAILFNWISMKAQQLAVKMGDPTGAQLEVIYRNRLARAWAKYTDDGDRSLFDSMLADILSEE